MAPTRRRTGSGSTGEKGEAGRPPDDEWDDDVAMGFASNPWRPEWNDHPELRRTLPEVSPEQLFATLSGSQPAPLSDRERQALVGALAFVRLGYAQTPQQDHESRAAIRAALAQVEAIDGKRAEQLTAEERALRSEHFKPVLRGGERDLEIDRTGSIPPIGRPAGATEDTQRLRGLAIDTRLRVADLLRRLHAAEVDTPARLWPRARAHLLEGVEEPLRTWIESAAGVVGSNAPRRVAALLIEVIALRAQAEIGEGRPDDPMRERVRRALLPRPSAGK